MLGAMYNTGQGVALDHAEAVKWFRAAARQGDAGAGQSGLAYEESALAFPDHPAPMWYWLPLLRAMLTLMRSCRP